MNSQRNGKQSNNNPLIFIVVIVVFLLGWELAAYFSLLSAIFFPAPSIIIKTFVRLIANGTLIENTGATLFRITLGSLAGIIPGITLGVLMGWSKRIRSLLDPLIAAVHPIPKIAIFPLVLIIFGIGELSNIVVIAISAFFPSLITTMTGVQHLDPVYFEVAQNYGADRWKMFSRVLFPSSLPSILSGVRLGLNTGLLLTIALELLSTQHGLGVMIWFSWQTLRVEELYATLIMISLLGIVINIGLKALFEWIAPWGKEFS
jgi:ABC-type nitrate/sulfonate/bicarbonate transport system permease component